MAINDMQQKIENRTVLMEKIEVMIKSRYRVSSATLADQAMNKTLAEVTKTAITQSEAILDELGQRKKAKVMSPEELDMWKLRSKEARDRFERDMDSEKGAYSETGKSYE